MTRLPAVALALLMASCGASDEPTEAQTAQACSVAGENQAELTEACVAGIKQQVMQDRSNYFLILLDVEKNHFIQGAFLAETALIVEIPGPQFAALEESSIEALGQQGMEINPGTGNYTLVVPEAELSGADLEKRVLALADALGYPEGVQVSYTVDPLAFVDEP